MSSEKSYLPTKIYDLSAVIANGASDSAELDLEGTELVGMFIPAAFTGTLLGLKTSPAAGGTYSTVQSSGLDFTLTVNTGKYIPIENLAIVAGLRFLKLSSNASEAADRTIILSVRPI